MIRVLSREPDRSMLGFSREVAREVTQPLWPSRVPLRMSCSVMLMEVVGVAVELLKSSIRRGIWTISCGRFNARSSLSLALAPSDEHLHAVGGASSENHFI